MFVRKLLITENDICKYGPNVVDIVNGFSMNWAGTGDYVF